MPGQLLLLWMLGGSVLLGERWSATRQHPVCAARRSCAQHQAKLLMLELVLTGFGAVLPLGLGLSVVSLLSPSWC